MGVPIATAAAREQVTLPPKADPGSMLGFLFSVNYFCRFTQIILAGSP